MNKAPLSNQSENLYLELLRLGETKIDWFMKGPNVQVLYNQQLKDEDGKVCGVGTVITNGVAREIVDAYYFYKRYLV